MSMPGDGPSARRWRLDDQPSKPPEEPPTPSRNSGRRVVLAMVAAVLTLWLGLSLAFRGWEARYRALADFGANRVAPAIDPLASTVPPDIPPADWRLAVADTHAMLLA